MRKLTASVLALALALGAGAALVVTVQPAAAAKIELRKEVREKFVAAQAAGQKGNFNEAIKLLKEAKAVGSLKPDEEYAVNELLIWAASSAHDWPLLAATIEERLATGRVTDKLQKLRVLSNAYYEAGDLRKTVDAANRVLAAGGGSADDLTVLGNAQFQLKDYRAASVTLEKAYAASTSAGKSAKSRTALLEMLNTAYFTQGDMTKRMNTLVRLMSVAPSQKVFEQVANAVVKDAGRDSVILLNLYRLGARKSVLAKDDYAKWADAALDLSSPGEAITALEKGLAAGAIKKDDRSTRLLADSRTQLAALKTNLVQQEKEARALAHGEGEVRLANSYFTLGDYARAIEATKRGLTKGRVKRPDEANMLLGIASIETRKSGEAKAAFEAARAANPKMSPIADLWIATAI